MILETRAVPPFLKNGYVLGCQETREGVVIDPGDEVLELLEVVAREHLAVRYILLTHAHIDHVTGVARAKGALGAPIGLHSADLFLYNAVVEQGRAFGVASEPQPPPDFFFNQVAAPQSAEGRRVSLDAPPRGPIRFGRYDVHVHHTPGHCPGGVCLQIVPAGTPSLTTRPSKLFVGDTLFAGSVGRTDLPGGDTLTLMRSIREVLFKFPDDSEVYSGHGPMTTIGHEKRTNPFLLAVM